MPAPIYFAHKILKVLSEKRRFRRSIRFAARRQKSGHSEIRRRRNRSAAPKWWSRRSTMRRPATAKKYTPSMVRDMIEDTVASALPKGWMPRKSTDFLVNPTGNFVVGGPTAIAA